MTPRPDALRTRLHTAFVLTAVLLAALPGCGGSGGVDTGGTGVAPSTLAVGAISGFGSIVVAGVHYDETRARVLDGDDQPLDAAALALGAVVRVDASAITTAGTRQEATASTIHVSEAVIGPVEAVDAAAGTAVVLGQTVVVNAGTVFDSRLTGGLAALPVGTVVAVHGMPDSASHRIVATRVEPRTAPARYVVRGGVSTLDLAAQRLSVGALVVNLAEASPLPAALAPGRSVRIALRTEPVAGVWTAIALRLDDPSLPDRDAVELEGRVTAVVSATQFSVSGVPVDASAANVTGTVVLGARVEVEGRSSAGTLIARSVRVEADEGGGSGVVEIEGTISLADPAARTFVVRGLTVSWSDATRFDSSTGDDIRDGRRAAVTGRLAADQSRIEATRVHVER